MKYILDSTISLNSIIVSHVPEGLQVIVTLASLMAEKWMAKNNSLVKNLEAMETPSQSTWQDWHLGSQQDPSVAWQSNTCGWHTWKADKPTTLSLQL